MKQETNWLAATLPELLSAASARAMPSAPGWIALRDAATRLDQHAFSLLVVIDAGEADARGLTSALGARGSILSLDECEADPLSIISAQRVVIAVAAGRTLDARAVRLLSTAVAGRPPATWRLVVTDVHTLETVADLGIQERMSTNLYRQLDGTSPAPSIAFWSSAPSAACASRVAADSSDLRLWSGTSLARDVRDSLDAHGIDRLRAFAAMQADVDARAPAQEPARESDVSTRVPADADAPTLHASRRAREALTDVREALNSTLADATASARAAAGRFEPEHLATRIRREAARFPSQRRSLAADIVEKAWDAATVEFDAQLSQRMDIWRRFAGGRLALVDWSAFDVSSAGWDVGELLLEPDAAAAPLPFQGHSELSASFSGEGGTGTMTGAAGGAIAGFVFSLLLPFGAGLVSATATLAGGTVGAMSGRLVARRRQTDGEYTALLETLRRLRGDLEIQLRRRGERRRNSVEDDLVRRVEALIMARPPGPSGC